MTSIPWATTAPGLTWAIVPASIGGNGGWFYDLLRKAGVSRSLAHTLVEFVLRPLEIVLVLVVAWLIARLGSRVVRRIVTKMGRPAAHLSSSPRAGSRVITNAAVLANVWRFIVAIFAIAVILGMLGINLTPLLASATVIGATIGFGGQSLVRDYLSGFLLTVEDQFVIGDTISVNGVTGTVEDLSLRVTRVRAIDGSLIYVPNGDIRQLKNTSRGWAKAVVEVTVPITAASDLAKAVEVVTKAAELVVADAPEAAGCNQPPEVLGLVETSGGNGTLRVLVRANHGHRYIIERALRAAMAGALADADLWLEKTDPGSA
ncbi:MAG: mechanosensitive ion channel family protein [Acidimicrobiales bacterium]